MASHNAKSTRHSPLTHETKDTSKQDATQKALSKLFTNSTDYMKSVQADIQHLFVQQHESLQDQLARERQKINQLSAQNQELVRANAVLRETAGLHSRETGGRDAQIATMSKNLKDAQEELERATMARSEAESKAASATERMDPLTDRLENLSSIGKTLHENVVRGVERIAWLEEEMQGAVDEERMADLAMEMKDRVCLLAYNWRRIEARYAEVTRLGAWDE